MLEMQDWLNIVSWIIWGLPVICQIRCGGLGKRVTIFVVVGTGFRIY
jgi:ABC-type uncharacterized transport system permease subunit